jgi:hypothetical protein
MDEDGCLPDECYRYRAVDENGCNYDEYTGEEDCGNNPANCIDTCSNTIRGVKDYGTKDRGHGLSRLDIKNQLQYGPVVLCMEVYLDFAWGAPGQGGSFDENNIYRYDGTSPLLGHHAVLCVGYLDLGNNQNGYWLCKNSWGDWGNMDGFFRIYYGECGIDSMDMTWVTFDEFIDPPDNPTVTGPTSAKPGETCTYTFSTTEPDGDNIEYYINWGDMGDDMYTGWLGPYESGEPVPLSHTWDPYIKDTCTIYAKARAVDEYGATSGYGKLKVTMPKNKVLTRSDFNIRLQQIILRLLSKF